MRGLHKCYIQKLVTQRPWPPPLASGPPRLAAAAAAAAAGRWHLLWAGLIVASAGAAASPTTVGVAAQDRGLLLWVVAVAHAPRVHHS